MGDGGGPSGWFRDSCQNGHLTIAKLLVDHFCITPGDVNDGLYLACARGHVRVVQWLTSRPTNHIEVDTIDRAFSLVCGVGHLELAQMLTYWLVTRADIPSTSAIADKGFLYACNHGHLELAQWLALQTGWARDIPGIYGIGSYYAHRNGHLQLARWLEEHHTSTAEVAT